MKINVLKGSIPFILVFLAVYGLVLAETAGDKTFEAKRHYNFAIQNKNSGDYEEAKRQYEKSIAQCDTMYQVFFSYADLLAKMQRPEESHAALLRALILNPKHFQTMALIAERYRQTAKHDSALAMYERMYAVEPDRRELLASIAGYREFLGEMNAALQAYEELIKKGDDGYDTLMKAAALAGKEGKKEKVMEYAVMALEKKPKDIAALSMAAETSLELDDRDSAILYFRTLCEADSANVGALGQLEKLYRTRGDTDNLLWALERHLNAAPDDVKIIGEYSELLYARGSIEQGILYVKKGLAIDPSDGRLHILMGENYRRLNQNDKAVAEFRIALKDSAWSSSAQRLIWQIERPESSSEKNEKEFFNRGRTQSGKK